MSTSDIDQVWGSLATAVYEECRSHPDGGHNMQSTVRYTRAQRIRISKVLKFCIGGFAAGLEQTWQVELLPLKMLDKYEVLVPAFYSASQDCC